MNFPEDFLNKIIQGDALIELKKYPTESIDCVVTSPPYYLCRNYGKENEKVWDGDEKCKHEWCNTERYIHRGSANNTVHGAIMAGGLKVDWKETDSFCKKCGAWKGQLGLEPTFDDKVEVSAQEIASHFDMTRVAGMKNLKVLKDEKLLDSKTKDRTDFYYVPTELVFEISDYLEKLKEVPTGLNNN